MRSFRTAAVAVATAAAVTLTGTTVASAQSSAADTNPAATPEVKGEPHHPSNDSEFFGSFNDSEGNRIEDKKDDRGFKGVDAFGDETRWNEVNNAAKTWIAVTYAGIIGTVLGGIIGAVNWLKYNGILPR